MAHQLDHRSIFVVLHRDKICNTTRPPVPQLGRPVITRTRSVTCQCGQAGSLPREDLVEQEVREWARTTGKNVIKIGDRWVEA